jgi:hypothetical protein
LQQSKFKAKIVQNAKQYQLCKAVAVAFELFTKTGQDRRIIYLNKSMEGFFPLEIIHGRTGIAFPGHHGLF